MTSDTKAVDRRALLITDVTGPGGVGTHICQLTSIAQTQGWKLTILMDDARSLDIMADSFRRLNVPVIRRGLYTAFNDEQVIRQSVLSAFKVYKPDIVHVHCGSPRSALLPRELTIDNNIPLIFTEHFVSADIEISDDRLKRIKEVYRRTFAAIAVCQENLELLRNHFQFYAARQPVIRYGVDLSSEERRNYLLSFPLKAITVARLSRRKGIDILIQAIAGLSDKIRSKFQFTLVGNGEDENQLKQMVLGYDVERYVKFIGWTDDVQSLLDSHDLFILPSLSEGQPISLLEALACGLPCIASAVSGIPEVLGNNIYGCLVNPNNPMVLGEAIESFAKNPAVYQRKAQMARSYILANHNPEKNVGKILSLWNAAIKFSSI